MSRSRKHRPKADGSPPSGDSASGEPRGFFARRPILRFVLLFGLLWGLYELLFFAFVLESRPFNSYLGLNADLAGAIVRAMGHEVNVSGQHMSGPGFGMSIKHGCDALQPLGLFATAVVSFPAGIRKKAAGLVIGAVLLLAVNMIRIISLFFTGIYYPRIFEIMHVDVWQAAFVFLALSFWLIWAWWATRRPAPRSHVSG